MKDRGRHSVIIFLLLLIAQMVICNYCNFTPYLTLSILPAMILCLPISLNVITSMAIAFASGLAVDFIAEGIIGLNAIALVPVALVKKLVVRITLGEEMLMRNEDFAFKKNGAGKISFALILSQTVFFAIYILADGAGMRPFWFDLSRFLCSMLCSFPLAMVAIHILSAGDNY